MTNKFSTKKFGVNENQEIDKVEYSEDKRFDMCYIDSDTILHRSATFAQQDYLEVIHLPSGRVKEFPNVTSFGVRAGKIIPVDPDVEVREKEGKPVKWLGWTNYDREQKGLPPFKLGDFKITPLSKLDPRFDSVEEAVKNSLDSIGYTIGSIKKFMDSKDYRLVIGAGKGNYRDNEAKTIGYKSSRGEKPLFFSEIREAFVNQYKSKIIETVYAEAEDTLGWFANLERARVGDDFSKWKVCISYIDKDVDMVYAPSFSYDNFDKGWRYPTKLECAKCLIAQTISGDKTDTIEGIPTLTEEVTSKFGLRKANGCGKGTAEKLIAECTTEKEMWERACFAYQSYYGLDRVYKFKDVHGVEQSWTWHDYMQQTYILVKMQKHEGEISNLFEHLDYLGIDYENLLCQDTEEVVGDISDAVINLESIVKELKDELSSYKSLTKPKLIDKLESIEKIKDSLEDSVTLFRGNK